VEVLLVEDNPGDAWLVREAVLENDLPYRMTVARDGLTALEYLRQAGNGQSPRPDLILLDLNLPRMDGRELLAVIRPDAELGTILVAILTSSTGEQDVLVAHGLRSDAYFIKPMDYQGYVDILRRIDEFRRRAGRREGGR
jgi:CheY-like chemotaxis protein